MASAQTFAACSPTYNIDVTAPTSLAGTPFSGCSLSGSTISCTNDVNFSSNNACLTTTASPLLVNMNGNTFNWDGNNGSMGSATNPINLAAGTGTINVNGNSFTSYGNWSGSEIKCNTNPQTSINGSVIASSSNTCSGYVHSATFAPAVATVAASSITSSGAVLNGMVSSNGASTQVSFNYGLSAAYGSSAMASQSPLASAASNAAVSFPLAGLSCGTTYFFRVSATNNVGSTVASGLTFTTSACARLVSEYHLDAGPWAGVAGEVKDTSGNAFHAVALGLSTYPQALSATPARAGGSGTCGYANFAGAGTGQGLSAGTANLGIGGAYGVSVSAWVRWSVTPSSGSQWATIATNGASTSGQFMLQHSQTNSRFEFAAKSTVSRVYVQSRTAPVSGIWYHVVGVYDGVGVHIYVNGALDDNSTASLTGTVTPYLSSYKFNIGMDSIAARPFQGDVDELKVFSGALTPAQVAALYAETHACAGAAVDHYQLSLPSTSISCLPTTVTVTACANSSSPCSSAYTGASGATASLSTSGATLSTSVVSFNASGVATATLTYPLAADGTSVNVTLSGESIAATNARQCCADGASCSVVNSCSSTFNTAGFVISSSAGGAATTIPTQTAGSASGTLYLRAVKSSDGTTQACQPARSGAKNVNWAYQCNNPTTCYGSNLLSHNAGSATTIQGNPNTGVTSYTPVAMTFDANGNAPFTFNYADVGRITLWASTTINSATLSGSSNPFVTKPGGFTVSGIKQTASPALSNPAASGPSGTAFVKAGESFTVTVSAITSGGVATPNYGRETTPEGVLLTSALVLPSGGNAGVLGNGTVAGPAFGNGLAILTNLNWSEVGIINLSGSVADGDYLGVGNVTGSASANIGRFYPDHFDTTVTAQGCSTFTYSGQPLALDVVAKNINNAITQNYSGGSWGRAVTLSDANAVAGIVTSGASVPATSFVAGVASVTPTYTFTSRGTSPSVIKLRATESVGGDSVSSASGIEAISTIVSGRMRLLNAYGSERLDLPLVTRLEYYDGLVSSGWRSSTGGYVDSCTKLTAANFAFTTTASNCATTVAACASAVSLSATGSDPYQSPWTVILLKPGVTSNACVSVNLDGSAAGNRCTAIGGVGASAASAAAPWLKYPWSNATASNPEARFTFGLYKSPLIYRRENY